MEGANPEHRLSNRKWIIGLVALCLAGWVVACASMSSESAIEDRTCDEWADAAVASEQWPEAVKRHEQVLRKDVSNCLAMYHLGYIWGKMDDHANEIHWYENAIACGFTQSDTLYFNLGMAHFDLHQLELANKAFKKAVALNPGKADNHFGLGLTANAGGRTEVAQGALNQAISVSPHHWDARILLVETYLDQGRIALAGQHLAFLMERIPQNPEVNLLNQRYKKRRITAYD